MVLFTQDKIILFYTWIAPLNQWFVSEMVLFSELGSFKACRGERQSAPELRNELGI